MASFIDRTFDFLNRHSGSSGSENLIENEEQPEIVVTAAAFSGTSGAVRVRTISRCESESGTTSAHVRVRSMCESEISEVPSEPPLFTEEEEAWMMRNPKATFVIGSLLAFASGLSVTVNNFITKGAKLNFGEILAVRGIVQTLLMLIAVKVQGVNLFPKHWSERIMLCLIGLFGGLTIMCTFACVKFMPVGDAMTLIFTNPLFTMIFAAIFLGHRLSTTKCLSALVLMAGIILVTKPPFLFPVTASDNGHNATDPIRNESLISKLMADYSDREFVLFDPSKIDPDLVNPDPHDLYFVGALIALSSAIFSAVNNIIMAKFGGVLPASLQLFYIGIGGIMVAGLCQFVDDNDRFFTREIYDITGNEWGICIGLALIGMAGFACTVNSLAMIPPSTAATLRTSQIIVAFIAQILIMQVMPAVLDIVGASLVFLAAMAITFEPQIQSQLMRCCTCCRPRSSSN